MEKVGKEQIKRKLHNQIKAEKEQNRNQNRINESQALFYDVNL